MNIGNNNNMDDTTDTHNTNEEKFYSIGEVSSITGVKSTVLRFWETEFVELSPQKNKFGHRIYRQYDINIILKIKKLLYEDGFTIKGAKAILQSNRDAGDENVNLEDTYNKSNNSNTKLSSKSYTYIKKELKDILKELKDMKKERKI